MNITIKNDKITTTNKDIDLTDFLRIENVEIDMNVIATVAGQFVSVPKATITASMINANIKADGTLLLDFNELSDDSLVYVYEELVLVMQEKGLIKEPIS